MGDPVGACKRFSNPRHPINFSSSKDRARCTYIRVDRVRHDVNPLHITTHTPLPCRRRSNASSTSCHREGPVSHFDDCHSRCGPHARSALPLICPAVTTQTATSTTNIFSTSSSTRGSPTRPSQQTASISSRESCVYGRNIHSHVFFNSWHGKALGQVDTTSGSFLKDVGLFDNLEFGISNRDVRSMSLSTRKLLELSFLSLLDSGIDYRGRNVGCYMSGVAFDIMSAADPVSIVIFCHEILTHFQIGRIRSSRLIRWNSCYDREQGFVSFGSPRPINSHGYCM